MMSDKFEALSQPVAYTFDEQSKPIYSQEYVTALLAALEEKGQRIAELERITEGVDQLAIAGGWTARGMSEYAQSLETRNAELEQRLQQPIKLPKREIGMAYEFMSDHIVVSLAAVLVEAATAGFKAEVEGE